MPDFEDRLRAAGEQLPLPGDAETARARRRVLAAATSDHPPAARVRAGRRAPALALALALLAGAFGAGYAVASASRTQPPAPQEPRPAPRQEAGPGFLPAPGWDVAASNAGLPPGATAATATNVSGSRLGPNGVRLEATFRPAGTRRPPERLLPLRLDDARPAAGRVRSLAAAVGGYDVEVTIRFGRAGPAEAVVAAAREQLGRLVVPACPDAQPLDEADLPAARDHVLGWLPAHYPNDAADLAGAHAVASLGAAMPRSGMARSACGAEVMARTAEVDVVLPPLARVSASLSQLSFFVSREPGGWKVWQRVR